MYRYDAIDQQIVDERVREFRDQTARHLAGRLGEDEYRQLRLRNGLYLQRHAYMLRVAIPYGLLSSTQLRMLAHIARTYDRGSGHFTTRQNIQYNWLALERVPDLLADLATVQMHAIQTSGNCVRNITADHLAGVAENEVADPRPFAEILRQWSTLHPEFSYLPRKFKIALSGCERDGAAVAFHDIGYRLVRNERGELGFRILVGGGMGRTPLVAQVIEPFVEVADLLSYTEAILRVYNLEGNRNQLFKARIKILVRDLGIDVFRERVRREWAAIRHGPARLDPQEVERVAAHFAPPAYRADVVDESAALAARDRDFGRWWSHNTRPHRVPGYRVVWISLKRKGVAPGDATSEEMELIADLADRYSFGQIRATHDQNLLLADVSASDLPALWERLREAGLATPNMGTLTDVICCPGLDFCSLANARSIPLAEAVAERFDELDYLHDLGELKLKMSGCINSCGHHHVGHIGILGVDMKGTEMYQILLGGSEGDDASIGRWIGPALPAQRVIPALEQLLAVYVEQREGSERFLDVVRRIGLKPFSERVYAH